MRKARIVATLSYHSAPHKPSSLMMGRAPGDHCSTMTKLPTFTDDAPKFLAMDRALGTTKLYLATSGALSYLMVLRINK